MKRAINILKHRLERLEQDKDEAVQSLDRTQLQGYLKTYIIEARVLKDSIEELEFDYKDFMIEMKMDG